MSITLLCQHAKYSAHQLANCSTQAKHHALHMMAERLLASSHRIFKANQQDIAAAKQKGLSRAMLDRLTLTEQRLVAMAEGIKAIAALPDPTRRTLAKWQQSNGLTIQRVSVPIGVIAVIYEARPNVTTDAAALCIQSGNAVILRGGSESFYSNQAIMQVITDTLAGSALPKQCVQMIGDTDRTLVHELIQQDETIDVVIPRGGETLIRYLMEHSKIPLFKHLQGLCHTYIHQDADPEKALQICLNAKLRRTGICGATETVLIDQALAQTVLPPLISALQSEGCEIRGDTNVCTLVNDENVLLATEQDWQTEYLDAILSIRIVDDINHAIKHIQQYSSHHTDAIITEDTNAAQQFFNEVDSAIVMHNTSTQFADGGEFGMGAEIGIATGKLHARGPVGVEQLTTFKYLVCSEGATRGN